MSIKIYSDSLSIGSKKIAGVHLVTFGIGKDGLGPHLHVGAYAANKRWSSTINLSWFRRQSLRVKYHVPRLLRRLNPMPVYWICDSRDCDHVRVVSAHRSATGWQFIKRTDLEYEYAEGPTHIRTVSKKTHDAHQTTQRDYIAEAHENGHPYSVDY